MGNKTEWTIEDSSLKWVGGLPVIPEGSNVINISRKDMGLPPAHVVHEVITHIDDVRDETRDILESLNKNGILNVLREKLLELKNSIEHDDEILGLINNAFGVLKGEYTDFKERYLDFLDAVEAKLGQYDDKYCCEGQILRGFIDAQYEILAVEAGRSNRSQIDHDREAQVA